MSRMPFVITLIVSGTLVGWLYFVQDGESDRRSRPGGARPKAQVFGFPDPRGILVDLREKEIGSCPGARFRSESPDFVVWDDGTVISRNATYDYSQGKIPISTAQRWARTFRAYALIGQGVECGSPGNSPSRNDETRLRGRVDGVGKSLLIRGLGSSGADHTAECLDCAPLRPLARMLEEIDEQRHGGNLQALTGVPVEVYLEWRSCGCRNHPEIVSVSKEWPLAHSRPARICGEGRRVRIRLEDAAEIRALTQALARSAAVLDGGEIYTCFMRPLPEAPKDGALARR